VDGRRSDVVVKVPDGCISAAGRENDRVNAECRHDTDADRYPVVQSPLAAIRVHSRFPVLSCRRSARLCAFCGANVRFLLSVWCSQILYFPGQLEHSLEGRLGFAVAIKEERPTAATPGVGIIRTPEGDYFHGVAMLEKGAENTGVSFG
jgi:hypothetical protein